MLSKNETPFAAIGFEQMHRDGMWMAIAAARACYDLHPDGRLTQAGKQALVLSDVYDGAPATGPLLAASDLVPFRPAADVTVLADAHAPDGEAAASWLVGVRVDAHQSVLRVHGPRQWEPRAGGRFALGRVQPALRVALDYRLASGGRMIGDPKGASEERNPVGLGMIDAKYTSPLHAYDAPQVDSEAQPIADPLARPEPMGFGAVAGAWAGRRKFAGTYNEAWRADRAPRLPADFDYAFHNIAHPSLILSGYLPAGTLLHLGRLTQSRTLHFVVPDIEPYARFIWSDGREVYARMNRDRLHIDLRGEAPWPVAITFRAWIEICPSFSRLDLGLTDATGARELPVSVETGLREAVS